MDIILFAIIGAQIAPTFAYWWVFGIWCFLRIIWIFIKIYKELLDKL